MNLCPKANLEFYAGWLDSQEGTSISIDTHGEGVLVGVTSARHKFATRGLSLGLSTSVCISDNVSFIASGWYLVPSNTNSREEYTAIAPLERTWDVSPQWWYVEGLFSLGQPCGGITLLAGLRYDNYGVKFKNPADISGLLPINSETADATSEGWIPLIGTQWASKGESQSLVVRAVGIPTLVGSVRYKETLEGIDRANVSGSYNGGGFLEFFAEYTKNFCSGSAGLFGRWNVAQGYSNVHTDVNDPVVGRLPGDNSWKLSLHRNTWTVGGVFSVNFDMPSY